MRREIQVSLRKWRTSTDRKPLILRGARQVGKTHALRTFGETDFRVAHYFNFEEDDKLTKVFDQDLKPARILDDLRFYSNHPIETPHDLLILDEVQRCPRALTSLKYFCEEKRDLAVCAAGSLLGVCLNVESFPVGQVSFLTLKPMTFVEFVEGIGEDALATLLHSHDPHEPYPGPAHERLWELWKQYLVVGGLPEVVNTYRGLRDNVFDAMQNARRLQRDLLNAYLADIAKHSGKTNALHIERVWRNVPVQLARTQDGSAPKFKFRDVIPGVRGYERLSGPLEWLEAADLIMRTSIVDAVALPLSGLAAENRFKLYVFDIGMLGALADIAPAVFLRYGFGSYQGYVAENFVAQELRAAGMDHLYSWKGRLSEIEFLLESADGVVPAEVKSGVATYSRSLSVYEDRHKPSRSYVLSARNSARRATRYYVPIYATGILARRLLSATPA